MQTYDGYMIYYKQTPFLNVVEAEQKVVWQFVQDYCATNRINLVADEWVVFPIKSIIGRSVQDKMQRAKNPFMIDNQQGGGGGGSLYAREGDIRVKMNPRTWD